MEPERGSVWWGPALFKEGDMYRPWLVLSDEIHPFAEEECIGVGLTTSPHDAGLLIESEHWTDGGTPRRSYVSPWYCTTLKHTDFDRYQGTLEPAFVSEVSSRLANYVDRD